MTRTLERSVIAGLLALCGSFCFLKQDATGLYKIGGSILILVAVLVIYTMPAMRNFRWNISTRLKYNLDDPRWVLVKFGTMSYPRFMSNEKYHLGITVTYGGDKGIQGNWAFVLSKKRGAYVGGGNYLTSFSWHYFDGMPDANDFERLWKWLHENNMDEFCSGATDLVKEIYLHIISHAKAYL